MDITITRAIAVIQGLQKRLPLHSLTVALDCMRKCQKLEQILAMDDEFHRRTIKISELKMILDEDDIDIRNECGEVLGVQCQARDCEECEEGLALMELYKK